MSAEESEWIAVALLGRTRGNLGEITAVALSGKRERYEFLNEVFLFGGAAMRPSGIPPSGLGERLEVERTWFHDNTLIFKFRGVDSISDAERLTGSEVRVPASERIELEPGEFFVADLVGCEVTDRITGEDLGRVARFEDGGGSGLLALDGGLLIPFARKICVEIDPAAKRIVVELPEGLKELNRQ